MKEPMSEERLTEIRQFLSWNPPYLEALSVPQLAINHLDETLAELDRLRVEQARVRDEVRAALEMAHQEEAENAAMRPIVEAVGGGRVYSGAQLMNMGDDGLVPAGVDAVGLRDLAWSALLLAKEGE